MSLPRPGTPPLLAVLAVVSLVTGFSGCGSKSAGANGAPTAGAKIRIGTNRALGTVTPYVARAQGQFRRAGLDIDIVDFSDGSTLMEAFASGQLDVALLGIAPAAIWHGKGVGLKVVASANGGGHVLISRAGSGIESLRDLRGKKVATPKPGTVTDTVFRAHVAGELAGLDPEKDIQLVPDVAPADMPTAVFVSREVDAAITWEPFASQAEAQFKNVKVVFDGAAEWRRNHPEAAQLYPVNVVIARQSFIDSRPTDLRRFLTAYVETVHFINRQPAEANKIIASEIQLSPEIVAAARRRIDYTAAVDVDASLKTIEWAHRLGYLKTMPEASAFFDTSYLPAGERSVQVNP